MIIDGWLDEEWYRNGVMLVFRCARLLLELISHGVVTLVYNCIGRVWITRIRFI